MMRIWDTGSGRQLHRISAASASMPLAFSPDDQYLACWVLIGNESKMRLLRFAAGREVRTLTRFGTTGSMQHQWPSFDFTWPMFDGDRPLLAVMTADANPARPRGLCLLDWPSGRELGHLPGGDKAPLGFDREGALWTGKGSSTVLRWPRSTDAATGAIRLGPPEVVVSIPGAEGKDFSPDGRNLVLANFNQGALLLRGGPSGQLEPTGSQQDVRLAAISPDGRWVATGSWWCDSGVAAKVWDAQTGRLVKEFAVPGVCPVGFSPDGRWFVTGGGGTRLWRTGSWEEGPLVFAEGDAGWWTFSPDGRLLALRGHSRVRLVRPDSGAEVARLALAEHEFLSPLCFTPRGDELLVHGEESKIMYVWDLRLIRRQLAEMGLDWDDPPLPEDTSGPPVVPPAVEFVGADLAADPQKMRQYQHSLAALGLRANPFDAAAHAHIAQFLEDANPTAAFAHYSAALAFGPSQPLVAERRALMAYRLKRWPEAVADCSLVLRKNPDRLRSLYCRALAYQYLGRHADAVADLTAAMPHYPHDSRLYEWRAQSYDALGDKARAEADRRKILELAPEDSRQLNNRAWRLLTGPATLRDAATALNLAQKAVDLTPNEAMYLNTLGVAQYHNGLYKKAIPTLEKSLELGNGKTDAFDLFFLAMCHQHLGNPARAKECFDRAVRWRREQKTLPPQYIQELKAFQAEAEECLKQPSQATEP